MSTRFIHGGAFRDPTCTSKDIIPALRYIFPSETTTDSPLPVAGVASLNYRLVAYPNHATNPSQDNDPERNVQWPAMFLDVCAALRWLLKPHNNGSTRVEDLAGSGMGSQLRGCVAGKPFMLIGHSVGATMAVLAALHRKPLGSYPSDSGADDSLFDLLRDSLLENLRGVIALEGVYSFRSMHDNHPDPSIQPLYTSFINAAFGFDKPGPGYRGGWGQADLVQIVKEGKARLTHEVKAVILAHSQSDELVEWEQVIEMRSAFKEAGESEGGRVRVMEVGGCHDEIMESGKEVGRAIAELFKQLERQS